MKKKDEEMTNEELDAWLEELCTKGISATYTAEELRKRGLLKEKKNPSKKNILM